MFAKLKAYFESRKRERIKSVLQPGRTVSRFVARDVKRDIIVVASDEIDDGFVTVRMRTNNMLYIRNRLVAEHDFGPPERIAIANLWDWSGNPWGGLADGTSIVDHIGDVCSDAEDDR